VLREGDVMKLVVTVVGVDSYPRGFDDSR